MDNTVAIGNDLNHQNGRELCYVILRENYVLAIEFNSTIGEELFTDTPEWVSDRYEPAHSETSPVVSEDHTRMYFATGAELLGETSSLLAVDTRTGDIKPYSAPIGRAVGASPVIEYDTARGGNVIYIHSSEGPVYAFLDQGNSFHCVWRTPINWRMTGGNGAKSRGSSGLFYIPFKKGLIGSAYGGGFNTSLTANCKIPNPDPNCDCTAVGAKWSIPFDGSETDPYCTRSMGFNPLTGKSQIYFLTLQHLYSYEENTP